MIIKVDSFCKDITEILQQWKKDTNGTFKFTSQKQTARPKKIKIPKVTKVCKTEYRKLKNEQHNANTH